MILLFLSRRKIPNKYFTNSHEFFIFQQETHCYYLGFAKQPERADPSLQKRQHHRGGQAILQKVRHSVRKCAANACNALRHQHCEFRFGQRVMVIYSIWTFFG
jgi:hypothetical protein